MLGDGGKKSDDVTSPVEGEEYEDMTSYCLNVVESEEYVDMTSHLRSVVESFDGSSEDEEMIANTNNTTSLSPDQAHPVLPQWQQGQPMLPHQSKSPFRDAAVLIYGVQDSMVPAKEQQREGSVTTLYHLNH